MLILLKGNIGQIDADSIVDPLQRFIPAPPTSDLATTDVTVDDAATELHDTDPSAESSSVEPEPSAADLPLPGHTSESAPGVDERTEPEVTDVETSSAAALTDSVPGVVEESAVVYSSPEHAENVDAGGVVGQGQF